MFKRLIQAAGMLLCCAQFAPVALAVPVVAITAPANNASYTPPAAITLTANASDNAGGTISKVEFFNGATLIGTDTTAPYSISWNNVGTGSYTITAKATNNSNVATTSSAITVKVNAPPSVSLVAPIAGSSTPGLANITVSANASDSDGSIMKVEFYNGATLIGTSTALANPRSIVWSNVVPGSYNLTARAYDFQGGITNSSAAAITVTNPITVAISAPANNARYIAPAAITLSATASDVKGTISKVEFFNGATLIGTDTTAPYSITWSAVPIGSYSVTAKVTDNQNLTKTSSPIAITVANNAAPTVTLSAPAANTSYTAPAAITLTAAASDSDGTISKVEFYNGATLIGTDTTAPYSFTWGAVPLGTYSITAKATDNLGVVTTSTAVPIKVIANAAPTSTLVTPANNAKFTAPATISLTSTATPAAGNSIARVEYYRGSILIGSAAVAPYTFNWSSVPVGSYAINAIAVDNVGQYGASGIANVTVAANTAPTVTLSAPAANVSYSAPATIALSATATDSDGTISKVEFYNGATLIGTVTAAPYTFSWNAVPIGTYSITAKATDNLGAVTTSTAVPIKVIANAAPTASLLTPANNAKYIAPATISLSSTATPAAGNSIKQVNYYNGAALIGMSTVAPYSASWSGVLAGSYAITAKAIDNLGQSGTSAIANITVANNIAPTVSISATPLNATAPATINLTATAKDSDGSIAKVEFFNGASLLATITASPYTFNWNIVPAGTYSVTAKATDNLGTSTTSTPVNINVTAQVAQIYYVDNDQINTPRTITDSSGRVVWEWKGDAFGAQPPNDNPSGLGSFTFNPRMPGQYYDKESNLFQNGFRDYSPDLGRYIESDPVGLAAGPNTYAYVGGNPLSYVDPDGLQALPISLPLPAPGGGSTTSGAGRGGYDPKTDMYTPSPNYFPDWLRDLLTRPKEARASGEEKLPIVNPGRDCDGNCKPCPPGKRWFVPKPGHGHDNGYWHTIVYNQDKKTCTCYPDRPSGGLDGF